MVYLKVDMHQGSVLSPLLFAVVMDVVPSEASCVRSSMIYENETRILVDDVGLKFERVDMQVIRWMCGVSMKD